MTTGGFPHLLDLNGDRGGDLFLYNKVTGERRFEVANATTGFTEVANTWDPGWQIYPARLNGDQSTDLFLYDPVRGFWIQALNNGGDGTFGREREFPRRRATCRLPPTTRDEDSTVKDAAGPPRDLIARKMAA